MPQFRPLIPSLFVASILALCSIPALAEMSCGPLDGHGYFHAHRAERMEQRQKILHEKLKLSAEQEAGWKKLIDSERSGPWATTTKRDDWAKLTTPERAEKMQERMTAQQAAMAEHLVVLKEFYATLTPAQKKTFDDFHVGPRRGMRGKPAPQSGPQPAPLPPRAAVGQS
jgi:Spy/CpxP family protein refolding chaperone